jgi:hypothetical protein
MRNTLCALAIVCCMAATADAQCCGDCDGSGDVTIDELITAVNNALNGCPPVPPTDGPPGTPTRKPTATKRPTMTRRPTATPTAGLRCGVTFTESSSASCSFIGNFNRGCGDALGSSFASDGGTLVVVINTMLDDPPFVYFAAQVTSDTTASLTLWSVDNFQNSVHPTAGDVQLTDNGSHLIVFPNDPPFMILSCNFVQYDGVIVATASDRRVAAHATASDWNATIARARALRDRPPPELAASSR